MKEMKFQPIQNEPVTNEIIAPLIHHKRLLLQCSIDQYLHYQIFPLLQLHYPYSDTTYSFS